MNRLELTLAARKWLLVFECLVLFIGGPAAGAGGLVPVLVIPILLLFSFGCWLVLKRVHKIHVWDLMQSKVASEEWRRVFVTYLVALPCLVALLWLLKPEALFSLPLHHTKIWLLITVGYPLVSVFPQELIYRAFFFERYHPLFGRGYGMILAGAAFFSFGHIVFHNWVAVALSFAGGWLFGRTYQRTTSLLLACAEHSLYGCAAFTIGYGEFFFDSTIRLNR